MAINTTIIDDLIDNTLQTLANIQLFGANLASYFASNTDTLGPILFVGLLVASIAGLTMAGGVSGLISKFKK
jgi:ABC-type enterochelin transport system permease subunit